MTNHSPHLLQEDLFKEYKTFQTFKLGFVDIKTQLKSEFALTADWNHITYDQKRQY